MEIKTVLFDLDGTLLPMDMDVFTKRYFGLLGAKMIPLGFEKKSLFESLWAGITAMVRNDGSVSNEEAFWATFTALLGDKALEHKGDLEEFYRVDFQNVQEACGCRPESNELIRRLKNAGRRVILATNPIFPSIATQSRIRWAGMQEEDFELVTAYENSRHCKPNLDYYRDILERQGLKAEECLMVGNDVTEDMVARELGMEVFLLTDCLLNKEEKDISVYPNGGFPELFAFLEEKGVI